MSKTKIHVITPESPPLTIEGKFKSIFLAGTIDDGNSIDWQSNLIDKILETEHSRSEQLIIFNPRRKNWNKNATDEEKYAQINWEFVNLNKADLIILNFLSDSKSPISLLEMGLFADKKKLIIICPKEFYRYHNVSYIAQKYNLPFFNTIEEIYEYFLN
jgi:hypothetical protein